MGRQRDAELRAAAPQLHDGLRGGAPAACHRSRRAEPHARRRRKCYQAALLLQALGQWCLGLCRARAPHRRQQHDPEPGALVRHGERDFAAAVRRQAGERHRRRGLLLERGAGEGRGERAPLLRPSCSSHDGHRLSRRFHCAIVVSRASRPVVLQVRGTVHVGPEPDAGDRGGVLLLLRSTTSAGSEFGLKVLATGDAGPSRRGSARTCLCVSHCNRSVLTVRRLGVVHTR